jgi:hypothetical protein
VILQRSRSTGARNRSAVDPCRARR